MVLSKIYPLTMSKNFVRCLFYVSKIFCSEKSLRIRDGCVSRFPVEVFFVSHYQKIMYCGPLCFIKALVSKKFFG